jgi:hypothetical protein
MRLSADKDVRELCLLVVATGKVSLAPGGKHIRLFWKSTGAPVMDRGFPVAISTSPSTLGWRKAAVDQLVRVGVFERAPKRRPKPYRRRSLAARVREIADPAADPARVRAVCREISRLEGMQGSAG